jgi:hypothetical protein
MLAALGKHALASITAPHKIVTRITLTAKILNMPRSTRLFTSRNLLF